MIFRNLTRLMMVLAVTAALAQGTPPTPTVPGGAAVMNQRRGFPGRRGPASKPNPNLQAPASLTQRVQDMESTLAQMHVVLKKMQDKQAKSGVKNSLAKANLDMWGLMVGHMDKELQELKLALAMREDMEARRAALYKQADAKADAEAQAARAAQAAALAAKTSGETATPAPGAQSVGQTAPAQPSATPPATPPANSSSSKN